MADDDVEEMRHLRSRFNVGLRTTELQRDVDASDGESDDSKKSVPVISSKPAPEAKGIASADDETDAVTAVMGFSGFSSGRKKSRSLDVETLGQDIQKSRQKARKHDSGSENDEPGPLPPDPRFPSLLLKEKPKSSLQRDLDRHHRIFPIYRTIWSTIIPIFLTLKMSITQPVRTTEYPAAMISLLSMEISRDYKKMFSKVNKALRNPEQLSRTTKDADIRTAPKQKKSVNPTPLQITALNVDPVGARFATGSVDYEVKLWDFGGMQANLNPFRTCKPCESHIINNISFSNGGEQLLVTPGSAQAKIIDRDGFNVVECPKGFQYIMNPKTTHGHISMLNSGWFSPKNKSEFLTCSDDTSVRLWDTSTAKEKHKHCLTPTSAAKHIRTGVSTCAYSKDGKFIAAAGRDGSVFIWELASNLVNPLHTIKNAHQNELGTSSLCFSYDGKSIASRGLDNTVKLWNIDGKKPVFVFEAKDLEAIFLQGDVIFSPNDKMVVTGTSVKKNSGEKSKLVFLERLTGRILKELPVGDSSVIRVAWHPKLNQIFASTAEGTVKVFFDPNISHNGALLCRTSKKRRAKLSDAVTADYVYTPFALPMFKEDKQRSKHAQFERNRKDPVKSHRPDLPVTGPGTQGRVGQAGGTLSSYLVRKLGYATKRPDEDINPREALLRHAEEAAKHPFYVSPAYAKTQPKPIFQNPDDVAGWSGESAPKKVKR